MLGAVRAHYSSVLNLQFVNIFYRNTLIILFRAEDHLYKISLYLSGSLKSIYL